MHIKVLGPMTKQCELLLQNAAIAAKKLKCHAEFERVNDLLRVVAYGVMALPALVIDEKVVSGGGGVRGGGKKRSRRQCAAC